MLGNLSWDGIGKFLVYQVRNLDRKQVFSFFYRRYITILITKSYIITYCRYKHISA